MPQLERASGVVLEVPDGVAVIENAGVRRRRRGDVAPEPAGALADVVAALSASEFAVVDTFELAAEADTPGRRRRGPADAPDTARVTVSVEANESAAVLLEEDGVLSWQFPGSSTAGGPPVGRRRRRGEPETGRELIFDLDFGGAAPVAPGRRRRIPILGKRIEKVTAAVLRFALPPVIGAVVGHLERNRRTRLVNLLGQDADSWVEFEGSAPAVTGRAKALLFIHGTFSSTKGGFGALAATDWGRGFLAGAIGSYDIVVAYDHRTLSVDPAENATDLLDRLRALWPDGKVDLDVVCHSRGGLVFRSLVEKVVLAYPWGGKFGKAVFVAGANSGTELANPENWERLADLYTNLASAAARGLAIITPGTAAAGLVLAEVIDGVGTLVKTIVARGVKENDIPGLAAMWPAGPFIQQINIVDPVQPAPANSTYYAVTSNFEAALREADSELPARLLALLRDGLIDQLIPEDNDTVVDVASMTKIDPAAGVMFDGTLDYGANGAVYHTNYFHQESTVRAIAEWLGVVPAAAGRGSRHRRGASKPTGQDTHVISGQRLFEEDLVAELNSTTARYIVIDREPYLRYAFRRDELRRGFDFASRRGMYGAPLQDALELREEMASSQVAEGEPLPAVPPPDPDSWPSRFRTVVVSEAGVPLRVEARGEALTAAQLAELQAGVLFAPIAVSGLGDAGGAPELPMTNGGVPPPRRTRGQRSKPPMAAAEPPPDMPALPEESGPVTLNAAAWTDAEIEVNQGATLTVNISRESISLPDGTAAGLATGEADASKDLRVMVQARKNVKVTGKSMLTAPVPNAGEPAELYFDIVATDLGEAQVDVIIRQTESPIARISLRPTVVAQIAGAGGRAESAASMTPSPGPGTPRHQLYISEEERGGQVTYSFHLELLRPGQPPEPVMDESTPLRGSKNDYITGLYKRIEDMWGDDRTQIADFAQQMRSEGGTLWDELVPDRIKRALWDNRTTIDFIQVYSDEPFVPWELVHMKEPGKRVLPRESLFLGELGMVRWMFPQADGIGCNRGPSTIRVRRGKVAAIVPEYQPGSGWELDSAATELKTLGDAFGAVVRIPATFSAVRDALTAGYDVIHYAGHGVGDSNNIGDESLVLSVSADGGKWQPDVMFRAQDIANHAQLSESPCADSRPLVVLNCCETGQSGYTLTSIGGMASALLNAGAGVVVSPLWSVDDVAAAEFTKAFYTAMRGGTTLADAARAARTAIREAGDQTWLAYTIYGEPTARLA